MKTATFCELSGISLRSEFVPLSRSRNVGEPFPTLNWRVTVCKDGKHILTTDYSKGMGHCPAWVENPGRSAPHLDARCAWECESGLVSDVRKNPDGSISFIAKRSPLPGGRSAISSVPGPSPFDVFYALCLDAEAINFPTYEDYAPELGLDSDSRKGEAIYRACLKIGLALRSGLGDELLAKLSACVRAEDLEDPWEPGPPE